jgi:hypothetical protein
MEGFFSYLDSRYRSSMNMKYPMALAIMGLILGQASLHARAVRIWSYDELLKASDVVAIVEPIKSENNRSQFEWADSAECFQGLSTTFKVHSYFKGANSTTEIVVKHFGHIAGKMFPANGPELAYFAIGPQSFDVSAPQKDKPGANEVIERVSTNNPCWLAFLKRNDDGTFVPVTGQIDSLMSFRWLADHMPGSIEAP